MINAVGAVTTGVVLCVVTATKFKGGAWLSILVMALIVPTLLAIHRHYLAIRKQLRRSAVVPGDVGANRVVIVVRRFDAATADALGYAKSTRPTEIHALHPTSAEAIAQGTKDRWRRLAGEGILIEPIPESDLLRSVRDYVHAIEREPNDFISVIIPERLKAASSPTCCVGAI